MMVYKQKVNGECGNYAFLTALEKAGSKVTEQQMVSLPHFLTDERAYNFMLKAWYIKDLARNRTITIAKNRLKKWMFVVAQTAVWNFSTGKKAPYIISFDSDQNHFFVIKEYIKETKLFLCQNCWWAEYGMKWDFFMREEDWKYLFETSCVIL